MRASRLRISSLSLVLAAALCSCLSGGFPGGSGTGYSRPGNYYPPYYPPTQAPAPTPTPPSPSPR